MSNKNILDGLKVDLTACAGTHDNHRPLKLSMTLRNLLHAAPVDGIRLAVDFMKRSGGCWNWNGPVNKTELIRIHWALVVVAWFRADNEIRTVLTPNRFLLEVMGALLGALPDIRKEKRSPYHHGIT